MYINLGLIGYPLHHTLSPLLHTHFFSLTGLNGGYTCFSVASSGEISDIISLFKKYSFIGINITVPYKTYIMEYCDDIDITAQEAGAVNTLLFKNNKIYGYNTDTYGFEKMLSSSEISVSGKNVLLLGAGGASKAVISYFKSNNPGKLTIANRTLKNAEKIASLCGFNVSVKNLDSLDGAEYDIIINATSIGLCGEKFPIAANALEAVVDLQYRPEVTPFLSLYSEKNIKKVNGFSMLIWQACRSFSIWTDREPEPDIEQLAEKAYKF